MQIEARSNGPGTDVFIQCQALHLVATNSDDEVVLAFLLNALRSGEQISVAYLDGRMTFEPAIDTPPTEHVHVRTLGQATLEKE